MAEHAGITDPNVHEPKNISTAASKAVYVCDGAGSGGWKRPPYTICGQMADVSAPGSVWVPVPVDGIITRWDTCLQGAITGADCTLKLQIVNVDVTGSGITIANASSAAGDVDSASPTAANTVTAGQAIEVVSAGESSTTAIITFTILVEPQ